MLHNLLKPFSPLVYKLVKWYHRKPRNLTRRGIKLRLLPSVFHPGYYLTTDIFLDYLLTLDIEGKRVLELGCGSGFISLYLTKHKNIESIASDINKVAVDGLIENASRNNVRIEVYHSDLFDKIPPVKFDLVIINPPFFKKDPASSDEFAFYAGVNFQYFKKLFKQLSSEEISVQRVLMILSENVDINDVEALASNESISMHVVAESVKNAEKFIVFELR